MKRSKRLLNTTFFLALSALLFVPVLINAISAYALAPPTYKSQFGAQLGDDQFMLPKGVAIDSAQNVYVADYELNIIKKFTSSGTLVTQWGEGGSGNGQFAGPTGIAIDGSDNIYITDQNNNRVQKFDSNGNYVLKWGTYGTGAGEFKGPTGIAVSGDGLIYVSDGWPNNRIEIFQSDGTYTTEFGGVVDGSLIYPYGISFTSSGAYFYVAGFGNNKIYRFDSSNNFVSSWAVAQPYWVAVGAGNNVHVSSGSAGSNSVYKFTATGACAAADHCPLIAGGSGDGQFSDPQGMAYDVSTISVYVVDTGNYRVQSFSSPANSPMTYTSQWGSRAFVNNDQLYRPSFITTDSAGNIYVVERLFLSNRIKKFSSSGVYVSTIDVSAHVSQAKDIAVSSTGVLYVVDDETSVQMYNSSDGSYIGAMVTGLFPSALDLDATDNVYVSGIDGDDITFVGVFSSAGDLLYQWTPIFPATASWIDVDSNQNVYVADGWGSTQVGKYTMTGDVVNNNFTVHGDAVGSLLDISDLETDSSNNLYIADHYRSKILMYNSEGDFVFEFGELGSGDGQFGLNSGSPYIGLAMTSGGDILATDSDNFRVQTFGYATTPPATPPSTPPVTPPAATTGTTTSTSSDDETDTTINVNSYSDFFESTGKTIDNLAVGDVLEFCINSTSIYEVCDSSDPDHHTLTIKSIDLEAGTITVTIASTPTDYVLSASSARQIDVDQDGTNDIELTATSLTATTTSIVFRSIAKVAAEDISSNVVEESTDESEPETSSNNWKWVLAAVGGVFLLAVLVAVIKYRGDDDLDGSSSSGSNGASKSSGSASSGGSNMNSNSSVYMPNSYSASIMAGVAETPRSVF